MGLSNGQEATIEPIIVEGQNVFEVVSFSERVARTSRLDETSLPFDFYRGAEGDLSYVTLSSLDSSLWVAPTSQDAFVFPVTENGGLADGKWPVYAGSEQVLVATYFFNEISWQSTHFPPAGQRPWLSDALLERPGSSMLSMSLSTDGRFSAFITSGVADGGQIVVRDSLTGDTVRSDCPSEHSAPVVSATQVNMGTPDRPLHALRLDPSNNPDGVVVWMLGGPRNSIYDPAHIEDLTPFLQRNYSALVVEYSGSRSPLINVSTRLPADPHNQILLDSDFINQYVRTNFPACDRNIFAGISFGGIFFQALTMIDDHCLNNALLVAPWLQYRDPTELFGARAFGNRDADSALLWESLAIGPQLHDPASDLRQLQRVHDTNCQYEGSIYAIFGASDSISLPRDLGACLAGDNIQLVVRQPPYDRHDLVLVQAATELDEAASFFAYEANIQGQREW